MIKKLWQQLKRDVPQILELASPLLIGQLAAIAFGVIDTAMTARYSTEDLAALGMAASIYISIYVGLTGIISALNPIAGQLFGAGRFGEIGEEVRQTFWLSMLIAFIGFAVMLYPDPFLALGGVSPEIESKAKLYLQILSLGLPATMAMRTLVAFHNAISQPKVITTLQLVSLALKIPLNIWFIFGGLGLDPMGGPGCALATVIIHWLGLFVLAYWVWIKPQYQPYRIFEKYSPPNWHRIWTILKLGTPIGLSYLIEVTSFAFMAIFISRFGTSMMAGHQIISNMGTVIYMVPLALSIATMTLIAQHLGAKKPYEAEQIGWSALMFTTSLCIIIGVIVWISQDFLLDLYSPSEEVRKNAKNLFIFIAFYQAVDALQVTTAFILRGYRVAFWPMCIYAISLWGVGLGGGYILAFNLFGNTPEIFQGANGFWMGNSTSLGLAAISLLALFWKTAKRFEKTKIEIEV
jgi:MATE family multidrug resistance protein